MNLTKKIYSIVFLAIITVWCSAFANAATPEAGKEYRILAQPQSTDAPNKIEVIEFFAYWCPHCNTLDPILAGWVKKQGAAISFKRVHISYDDNQLPFQRLFYSLEAMGKEDEFHSKIFKAIHVDHKILRTDQDMIGLITEYGIDPKKYVDISQSFSVAGKLTRAKAMQAAYKINDIGVPTIIIDGRYIASPSFIRELNPGMDDEGGSRNMLPVLDYLVLKAQPSHKK